MNESKLLEPDTYAVVDVLGHQTFAGKVSEHVIGGTAFIRVDVPELPEVRTETYRGESLSATRTSRTSPRSSASRKAERSATS